MSQYENVVILILSLAKLSELSAKSSLVQIRSQSKSLVASKAHSQEQ